MIANIASRRRRIVQPDWTARLAVWIGTDGAKKVRNSTLCRVRKLLTQSQRVNERTNERTQDRASQKKSSLSQTCFARAHDSHVFTLLCRRMKNLQSKELWDFAILLSGPIFLARDDSPNHWSDFDYYYYYYYQYYYYYYYHYHYQSLVFVELVLLVHLSGGIVIDYGFILELTSEDLIKQHMNSICFISRGLTCFAWP